MENLLSKLQFLIWYYNFVKRVKKMAKEKIIEAIENERD